MSKATILKTVKWILAIVLILYVSIELIDYGTKLYYEYHGTQWYPARIERITGIKVPHYEVLSHHVSRLYVEHDSQNAIIFVITACLNYPQKKKLKLSTTGLLSSTLKQDLPT